MSKATNRLNKILEAIDDVEFILSSGEIKVTAAIENKLIKPAIRMNLVRIAEQFAKLKDENEFTILEHFDKKDFRGISTIGNKAYAR